MGGDVIGWLLCKLGHHSCRTLHTPKGIGGQCQRCGRVFGWMTHEEIRACLEGRRGNVSPPCDAYIAADAEREAKAKPVKLPPAYVVRGPRGLQ